MARNDSDSQSSAKSIVSNVKDASLSGQQVGFNLLYGVTYKPLNQIASGMNWTINNSLKSAQLAIGNSNVPIYYFCPDNPNWEAYDCPETPSPDNPYDGCKWRVSTSQRMDPMTASARPGPDQVWLSVGLGAFTAQQLATACDMSQGLAAQYMVDYAPVRYLRYLVGQLPGTIPWVAGASHVSVSVTYTLSNGAKFEAVDWISQPVSGNCSDQVQSANIRFRACEEKLQCATSGTGPACNNSPFSTAVRYEQAANACFRLGLDLRDLIENGENGRCSGDQYIALSDVRGNAFNRARIAAAGAVAASSVVSNNWNILEEQMRALGRCSTKSFLTVAKMAYPGIDPVLEAWDRSQTIGQNIDLATVGSSEDILNQMLGFDGGPGTCGASITDALCSWSQDLAANKIKSAVGMKDPSTQIVGDIKKFGGTVAGSHTSEAHVFLSYWNKASEVCNTIDGLWEQVSPAISIAQECANYNTQEAKEKFDYWVATCKAYSLPTGN